MRKKLVGLALLGLLVGCSRTDRPPVAVGETATEEAAAATTQETTEIETEEMTAAETTIGETVTEEATVATTQETTEIETEEMTAAETTTEWVAHEPILVGSPELYWEEANEKANAEQKEALTYFKEHVEEINEDYLYIPCANDYFCCAKQIKNIMGDIPENQPRITVEQVREICSEYTKDTVTEENLDEKSLEIEERINAIAGAPDYAGGNNPRRNYRLKDSDTQFIVLWGDRGVGQISLYDRDPESGKIYEVEEIFHITWQGKPLDFYEENYEKANDEQKAALEELYRQYGVLTHCHEREIRVIMGEEPPVTSRVTVQMAVELLKPVVEKHANDFTSGADKQKLAKERMADFIAVFEEKGIQPDEVSGNGRQAIYYFSDTNMDGYVYIYKDNIEIYYANLEKEWMLYDYVDPQNSIYAKGITAEEILESVAQASQGNK